MKLRGKAWVFEGILDVDWEICPHEVLRQIRVKVAMGEIETKDLYKEYGQHCMTMLDPDFPKKVQPGDFLVGGDGVGYGHDHDHACMSIKGVGVGAVLCDASGHYFERNCIHHGLPVVQVKGILAATKQGDELEVDLVEGVVENITSGQELHFPPIPNFIIEIIQAGGLYPLLKSRIEAGEL